MSFAVLSAVIVVFMLVLILEQEPSQGRLVSSPMGLGRWLTGGNWAAKVGGALLSLGTGALLRYLMLHVALPAVDKLMAGAVVAAALGAASGVLASHRARRAISLALAGAALAVAYFTAYAAYGFFHFVQDLQALGLLFLVASVATMIAITRRAVSISVLAMLGAYVAPAFALESPGPVEVNGYYLAASLVTLAMVWVRGWRPLIHLSFLFTLAGALFFSWTRRFYEPQYYAQMEPLLLALVAVHLAMPILQVAPRPRADAAEDARSWRRRFDQWYFTALPLVAAALTLLLAPTLRRQGAFGLLGLGLLWLLAAAIERLRAGRASLGYLSIGAIFLVVAGLLGVVDLPLFLVAAIGLCAVLAAGGRLELPRGAELLVVILTLVSAAAYSLQSIFRPASGVPLMNGAFAEQFTLGLSLLAAGYALQRRDRAAAPIFLAYAAAWLLIALVREVARLDYAYLAEVGYGGLLVAMLAASAVAQWRRQAPGRLLMVLLGVALLATGVASAPRFAVQWLLPLMLAGQLLYSVLALQCQHAAAVDDATAELNGAIARSALPLLIVPWALAFASHLSSQRDDVLWTFMAASALAASLQAQWLVRRTRFWPNWLSPIGFFFFGALLFHETLWHIDRNAWDVAFELLAVVYLVETARFLAAAKTEDARWFGYAAILAVACVAAAMALRLFGPPGTLTIAALHDMVLPAIVSLLWATIGALLTWLATRQRSRTLWSLGALLLIATAIKLILFDFGSLGELGNIVATIAAGGVFLGVAWLAPFPPKGDAAPEETSSAAPATPRPAPASGSLRAIETWSVNGRGWIWVLVAGGAIDLYARWMTELQNLPPRVPPRSMASRPSVPSQATSQAPSLPQAPAAGHHSPPMDVCRSFGYQLPSQYVILAVGGPAMPQASAEPLGVQHVLAPLDVNVRPGPQSVVLALSATAPTLWRIHQAFPDQVVGVVLAGTYFSQLTGVYRAIPVLHAAQEDRSYCGYFQLDEPTPHAVNDFFNRLLAHAVDETVVLSGDAASATSGEAAAPQRRIAGTSGPLDIVSAVYWSPRNHRSRDLGPVLKAHCGTGHATCTIGCGGEVADDPDPGQPRNCDIEYRCGQGPVQMVQMQQGHVRQLVCP